MDDVTVIDSFIRGIMIKVQHQILLKKEISSQIVIEEVEVSIDDIIVVKVVIKLKHVNETAVDYKVEVSMKGVDVNFIYIATIHNFNSRDHHLL